MPSSKRIRPTEITIKIRCCQQGCTLTTQGDWKNKVCWHCDAIIHYERYPKTLITINEQDVTDNHDRWHVVNEVEVDEER